MIEFANLTPAEQGEALHFSELSHACRIDSGILHDAARCEHCKGASDELLAKGSERLPAAQVTTLSVSAGAQRCTLAFRRTSAVRREGVDMSQPYSRSYAGPRVLIRGPKGPEQDAKPRVLSVEEDRALTRPGVDSELEDVGPAVVSAYIEVEVTSCAVG